jgi:hypothetical protein
MLGILFKRFPMYSTLLLEKKSYEEISKLKNNCACIIVFQKTENEVLTYQTDITLETWRDGTLDNHMIYHENTKHYMVRIGNIPYLYHKKEWRCNDKKIEYRQIPSSLLALLSKKKKEQTIYTTAPEYFR